MNKFITLISASAAAVALLASCQTQNAPKNEALAGNAAEASVRAEGSFESDSAALVALYNKTQGADWFRHRAWLTSAPLDEWQGVTVKDVNGERRVVSLRIGGNNLQGTIPAEVGTLGALEVLDMGYNYHLEGSIPAEIYNLRNLVVLRLSFTNLTGELSRAIGNLAKLDTLDLRTSKWVHGGSSFDANPNLFTGAIPAEIGNLTNARFLDLSRQGFSGAIPAEIGNMSALNYLDLSNTKVSGNLPATLGDLKNLRILWINDARLTGEIPARLYGATSLKEIRMARNAFSGRLPEGIGSLKELEDLDLTGNNLEGELPAEMAVMPKLSLVYLTLNRFSGVAPQFGLAHLGGYTHFVLEPQQEGFGFDK